MDYQVNGSIDTNQPGEYDLTYVAEDSSGNATEAIRVVVVVELAAQGDTTAPIIQTWDYTSRHILVGDPFEDHGVTAWDETDGEIEVVLSGNLDTSTVGVYTQTYTATDSSGNTASESQTIFVVGSREELLVFIDNDDGQTTVLFTADPSIRGDLEVPATWQGKSVVEVNSLAWCDKLTSVTLPDSVTHLGYGAFQSCTSLKSIHIGAGLSTFGEWVFNADCDSLTAITVSANNQNYTSVDGALYSKDMKTLYSVPEGTTGEFVVSEEVNRLEDTALAGCKKLSSILFKGLTAPSLGTDVFEGLQMSYGDWFGYAKKYEGATGYEAGDYALIDFTTVSLEPEDTEAPILGLNGQAEVILEYPAGYVEEGAQAQDAVDGPVAVTISGEVNPQKLGEYELTYTAVDNAGNTASIKRTVTVVDTTNPVITLIGGTTIEIEVGSNYLEPGLSITDNYDGVIVDYQVNGSIDTNQPGEYDLTYVTEDSSGNATEATRLIKVAGSVDKGSPIVRLNGPATIILEYPEKYSEQGAQAQDAVDGQVAVTISGEVNPQKLGEYKLTYTAVDNAGNTASTTRTVTVVDTTNPVITLIGGTTIEIEVGSNYLEPGLSIADNYDGVIVDYQVNGSIDTNQPGEYDLTYVAEDSSGNATEAKRVVKVVEAEDTVPPVITIIGDSSLTIEFGDEYVEQGATAKDNKDGDLNVQIIGRVNVQKLGKYGITYAAIDKSKNLAQVTREITIVDTTPPTLTLNGESNMEVIRGVDWLDPGVTAIDNYDGELKEVLKSGSVDTSVAGTYFVSYFVSDSSGNRSSAKRTITVLAAKDTTPPVITVKGSEGGGNNNYIAYRTDGKWMANGRVLSGQEWADPGVKIIDDNDGEISSYVVKAIYENNEKLITGVVGQTQTNELRIKMLGDDFNVSKTGIVNLIYEVTDSAGNSSTAKRRIYLLPAFPDNVPVINEFIFDNFSKLSDFESYLSAYISDLNQPFSLNLEAQYTKNPKGLESGFTFRDVINPGRHLRNYIGYLPHNLTSNPAPWAWSLLSEDVNRFIPLVDLEINSSGIVLGRIRRDTYLVGPPMLGMSATVGNGGLLMAQVTWVGLR